jgi:2-amino-1-hydroxyethylphosphonate dioxygenase (glycine-forming)
MKKINANTLKELRHLFTKKGAEEYFGEKVSQYEHAAQALMLAISDEASLEMQVAAFLHDIGHMLTYTSENNMNIYGRLDHETAAKFWLRDRNFSEKIQIIVENHVPAKRYLSFKFPAYFEALSEASKKTLSFQGGIMNSTEAVDFENQMYFEESIKLRTWDDHAKEQNIELPSLEDCLEIVAKYLDRKNAEA